MTDWQNCINAFPVNKELIWLNNCGTTPAGLHVVNAVTRFIEGYAAKGVLTDTYTYNQVKTDIQGILARLLGCAPTELALIHNTSEGMNLISHGLSLQPGDEIILLENEYPSNIYPWRHLEKKGVHFVFTPMGDTPESFFDTFRERVTERTRIVALSAVHWCTGMPLPLTRIGHLCREKDIRFVLDGAQGVGMRPIDVKAMGIDFMAFSAWKWLMGPVGMGILYVSTDRLNEIEPVIIGTASVVDDMAYLPYKTELKPDADRFTISTPNFCDWVYFLASLTYLEQIGFDTVMKRIYTLAAHLKEGLRGTDFTLPADKFSQHSTGIVVCEKKGLPTGLAIERLKQSGIVAAERLGRVRFSPHILNSTQQLDRVVNTLREIRTEGSSP